jgi:hypothetical protein
MGQMRKITVEIDEGTLRAARAEGAGVAETIREALKALAHKRACQKLLAAEGKIQFDLTWRELRGKDDDD